MNTPKATQLTAGMSVGSVTSQDGTTIGYLRLGQGPAVVLLHGSMESASSHTRLALALADAFTVYLPDRRGRGMTGPYPSGYGIRTEVEDLQAILAESGAEMVFGVSAGALTSDAEVLGILEEDRNKIFAEAIDVILAIWERDPPYDIDLPNNRYKVSTAKTAALDLGIGIMGKPYQKPRPEIVGTVVAPFSPGVVLMGKRDFHPLSANFLLANHLKSHWTNYAKGKAEVGAKADVNDWRVARTIFVADDDKTALRYGRDDANSPYRFYFEQMGAKMRRGGRIYVFKKHKEQPDDEITHDYIMDHCVIAGTVNKVVDEILKLREQTGDFGELVYAGMDWVDPALGKRSMQLMAEQVMPRVNEAIGKTASAAAE